MMFEGSEKKFRSMVPRDYQPVVAHNDGNINNALVTLKDNSKLILIDYEYCGWNPPAFDLAAFMTAMAVDQNCPYATGIKIYNENFPEEEDERDMIIKAYMREMFNYLSKEEDLGTF